MAGRPSYTIGPGASVKLNIPPEWFCTLSAISRKTYNQAVAFKITGQRVSYFNFKSESPKRGPMTEDPSGKTTAPITSRDFPMTIDIQAYYADIAGPMSLKDLKKDDRKSAKVDLHESVKPPKASPDVPDYVTYFIFVEDTPDSAQVAGSGQFDDSVITVHLVKTNPNVIPPPPPDGTIPGYNPVLDRPRPSKLENYLKAYDVVFLIDDSGSMQGERWTEASLALNNLTDYILDNGWDSDGIDLRFLNSNTRFIFKQELVNGVQDKGKVATAMSNVKPDGSTPTGRRIQEILTAHINKLNAAKGTPAYGEIKPIDVICITDGEPNDDADHELGKMLVEANKTLLGPPPHHPNSMGVQFVQIGGDANAKDALTKLTQLDTGGMVDTVPYSGKGSISGDRLERILLGGLHPNVRQMLAP